MNLIHSGAHTGPGHSAEAGRSLASILKAGIWLIILAIMIPIGATAQMAGYGAIAGTVTDQSGAVIKGAAVTANLVSQNAKTVRSTTGAGDFNITPLTPGEYTLTVSSKGF